MRFVFWYAEKGYELKLGPMLSQGAARHGDSVELRPLESYAEPEHDGSIICGVVKRELIWDHAARSARLIYMDKGFVRSRQRYGDESLPAWWRLCLDGVHPSLATLAQPRPPDRAHFSGLLPMLSRRSPSRGAILIAGSSAKFHHTMKIEHPTKWTADLVEQIRRHSDAPIIYRPKPSWADAEPVPGTTFDHGQHTPISAALAKAACVITYGSIASVDAIRAGVPCIVLGNAPAAPVSGRAVSEITDPPWFSREEREAWASALAYSQFQPHELANGTAWAILMEQINGRA